jgi:hypothetical protein
MADIPDPNAPQQPQAQPAQASPMVGTVPIVDPYGKAWDIPMDKYKDAIAKGGKVGMDIKGPDGKTWLIPIDRVHDALAKGGEIVSAHGGRDVSQWNPADWSQNTDPDKAGVTGYLKGLWDSTLGGLHDVAKMTQDYYTDPNGRMDWKKELLDNPFTMVAHAIADPAHPLHVIVKGLLTSHYEQGKKTYTIAKGAFKNLIHGTSELMHGDMNAAERDITNANAGGLEAAGHGLATIVPIIGPAAAKAGEDIGKGDIAYGAGQGSGLIGSVVLPKVVGKIAPQLLSKIAPTTRVIEGESIPVTAGQAGSTAGKVAENVAKDTGLAGEHQLNKLADTQQAGAQKVISKVAGEQAKATATELQKATNPLTMSADQFKKVWDSAEQLKTADSFGDAATKMRQAASEHFKMIDEATDGEFTKLKDQRSALYREMRQPGSDVADIKSKIAELDGKENEMFKAHGMDDGKSVLDAARQAWKKSSAMDELDSRITRASREMLGDSIDSQRASKINGRAFNKYLNDMDPDKLKLAVGDASHAESLRKIATILESGQNAAKVNMAVRILRGSRIFAALSHPIAVGSSEGLSYILGKVLTNATAAKRLAQGLEVGASAPVIGSSMASALEGNRER